MAVPRSLLVPVDGSASSLRALSLACQRVKARRGGTVVALNVQPGMPASRFAPAASIRDHQERMSEEVFLKVDRVARREKIPVEKIMATGMPASIILRQVKRSRAGEIVMGTRGLGQIGGLLLGSVAMKIVQLSSVPVTLVR